MLNMPESTVKTYFSRSCVESSRAAYALHPSRSAKPVYFFMHQQTLPFTEHVYHGVRE
jgi:hypothetical protein